jgi:hypothetical protein
MALPLTVMKISTASGKPGNGHDVTILKDIELTENTVSYWADLSCFGSSIKIADQEGKNSC